MDHGRPQALSPMKRARCEARDGLVLLQPMWVCQSFSRRFVMYRLAVSVLFHEHFLSAITSHPRSWKADLQRVASGNRQQHGAPLDRSVGSDRGATARSPAVHFRDGPGPGLGSAFAAELPVECPDRHYPLLRRRCGNNRSCRRGRAGSAACAQCTTSRDAHGQHSHEIISNGEGFWTPTGTTCRSHAREPTHTAAPPPIRHHRFSVQHSVLPSPATVWRHWLRLPFPATTPRSLLVGENVTTLTRCISKTAGAEGYGSTVH